MASWQSHRASAGSLDDPGVADAVASGTHELTTPFVKTRSARAASRAIDESLKEARRFAAGTECASNAPPLPRKSRSGAKCQTGDGPRSNMHGQGTSTSLVSNLSFLSGSSRR
jgi:hypothetical protein